MDDIGHLVKNQFARNRNNIGRVRRRDGFQGFACVIFSVMKRREGGRKRNHREEWIEQPSLTFILFLQVTSSEILLFFQLVTEPILSAQMYQVLRIRNEHDG